MLESSKQVRVDNWGVYFLQRLQLFFSKTDFCDLTLQFEGNVQLKVHRLVMNACTEYFAFLEQTCPALEDNTIMMPSDLQADVIVPIVNFMYTGMLEYHPSVFEKLYKAAETMNIAVLTKLLEAQMNSSKNSIKPKRDVANNWPPKRVVTKPASPVSNELPNPAAIAAKKLPIWKRKQPLITASHPTPSSTFANSKWAADPTERDPLFVFDNTPKPTRFEWPDDDLPPVAPMDPSFDDISLTSKPLWTKEDDQKAAPSCDDSEQDTRHSSSKNNIISQDYDEDYHPSKELRSNEEASNTGDNLPKRRAELKLVSSPKRIKITDQDDETVICIKTNNPAELDHTKVVSELLKKYPELVKKKKNIKLKIVTSKNEQQPQFKGQTPIVKEKIKVKELNSPMEKLPQPSSTRKELKSEPNVAVRETHNQKENATTYRPSRTKIDFRCVSDDGPWTCMECLGDGEAPEFVLYYLFRKHMSDVHGMEFDNTLCKYCGKKCVTDTLMSYHLYTKHSLIPPVNVKFPKCPKCPFIAVSAERLKEHITIHGKDEVQCTNCKLGFYNKKFLNSHIQIIGHNNQTGKTGLECPYCKKKLQSSVGLFTHVRVQHIREAIRDGITSLNEKMDVDDGENNAMAKEEVVKAPLQPSVARLPDEKPVHQQTERVKILSNVKVSRPEESNVSAPNVVSAIAQEVTVSESNQIAVTTAGTALSNIGSSLATNLGLVDIVVLDDNQQYILQQPQGQAGNTEFILPELAANEGILQAATAASDINSTDELVMVLTDHDYQDDQNQGQGDNSNIVVLYSHPVEGQQGQFITSQGNLLVNSQGLLEIRNGAGITTTAGQILVNTSDNTTTTQATPSPIESIEMIRKEIEDSNVNGAEKKDAEEKENQELVVKPEHDEEIPQGDKVVPETEGSNGDVGLDVIDSSQVEPMEVDEIIPDIVNKALPEEDSVKDENMQVKEEDGNVFKEPHKPDMPEIAPVEAQEEVQSLDIPPDTPNLPPPERVPSPNLAKNNLIRNDPRDYETMEVDGCKSSTESQEIETPFDTVDAAGASSEQPPPVEETSSYTESVKEENLSFEDPADTVNPSDEPEPQSDNIPNADIQNSLNENKQNEFEQPTVISHENGTAEGEEEEYGQEEMEEQSLPIKQGDEDCERENENNQNAEAEQNDQNEHNESVQSNFEDFTDDSEHSCNQKTHKDLNKEILDDWDDTDSQPSQKSHDGGVQEVQELEQEQNQIVNEAAENVNKLMDDWDEEDEEQCK